MIKKKVIKLAQGFVDEVLRHKPYFRAVDRQGGWDLIIQGGSAVRGFNDQISDLDLFLVTSAANQVKFNLTPVHVYRYRNLDVDVSMIATEKVMRDVGNKTNYDWWVDSVILYARNEVIKQSFLEAASISQAEYLEIIWTNFVVYEINTGKIRQSLQRGDLISAYACFNENIEALIVTVLADKGIYCHNKWYGRNLRKFCATLHDEILTYYATSFRNFEMVNVKMRPHFLRILKKAGFSKEEMGNYEKCNLDKLLFQRC